MVKTAQASAGRRGKCPHCGAVVQIPAPVEQPRGAPNPPQAATSRQPKRPAAHIAPPGTIEFTCASCGKLVRTPLNAAGKKGKCPHCRAVVEIPWK
jgi:phage FluMu protein Com